MVIWSGIHKRKIVIQKEQFRKDNKTLIQESFIFNKISNFLNLRFKRVLYFFPVTNLSRHLLKVSDKNYDSVKNQEKLLTDRERLDFIKRIFIRREQ